jgi:two-component system, OmpR family, sensor histidine kinase CiaH
MARYYFVSFIVVLAYTILALLFWENSLQKLNNNIYLKDKKIIELQASTPEQKAAQYASIKDKQKRKRIQYIAEGATFLLMLVIGGVIVYLSFAKRLQLTTQQNNFMMAVTHELKTPVAGIKLSLETIRKRKLTQEQTNTLVDNSLTDAERLNELCSNILLGTQLESNQFIINIQPFNLSALISNCVQEFSNRYPAKQWVYNNYIPVEEYNGDSFLWKLIINNLLENAQKYAPDNTKVIVDIFISQSNILIQIIDEGAGIAEGEKKKIFQKFYRTGNENTRNSKGTGLGLYIVKRAIEQHKGTIKMEDNTPQGNIAIISIPQYT